MELEGLRKCDWQMLDANSKYIQDALKFKCKCDLQVKVSLVKKTQSCLLCILTYLWTPVMVPLQIGKDELIKMHTVRPSHWTMQVLVESNPINSFIIQLQKY